MYCNNYCLRKMLSRITILIIAIIFIISSLIASILNTINYYDRNNNSYDSVNNGKYGENDTVVIDDKLRHTIWFIQITDLHLSIYYDRKRSEDLLSFCMEYVEIISPLVVLATGDITDARTKDPMGSAQHMDEWMMYYDVLNKCNVNNRTNWLDIRGNHDNFNVYNSNSELNYFRKYSAIGPKINSNSYLFELKHDTETYSFIGVDACLSPGPKRPFNFIGLLTDSDMEAINKFKHESKQSNTTLWFGHYPTSSIAMPKQSLKHIINGPYFCGHFHSVGGLVEHMYATQPNGYLELELADWKHSRKFRLAAVDHGLFTFSDFSFGSNQWPLILITNPKPSLYLMPHFEPYHRIMKSTHIRVIVFSKYNINSVHVRIDHQNWVLMTHISGALYVHRWNPNNYSSGLHLIQVKAQDQNNQRVAEHQFSLDNSKPDFTFGGKFMLRVHSNAIGYSVFAVSVLTCIMPLLVLRFIDVFSKGSCICTNADRNFCRLLLFKFYLLANIDLTFYGLIAIPIYASIGPWFVGYMIDKHFSICFVWAIFIDGSYLPGGLTYIMGSIILIFFYIPIAFCLAHIVYCRYRQLSLNNVNDTNSTISTYIRFRHFLFLLIIICNCLYSLIYYFAYGIIAYLFGFLNTWSIIVYLIIWHFSIRLQPKAFPKTIRSSITTKQNDESLSRMLNKNN